MIKKDLKNRPTVLKTLRLLVEVVESDNGFVYVIRTENGSPISSSSSLGKFLDDVKNVCTDFENYVPANTDCHGESEN